jgi:iron complex transport system substrate-binding protein
MASGEKHRSRRALYLGLAVVVIVLAAVVALITYPSFKQPAEEKREAYITIQDMVGRSVNVPTSIKRVVTTLPDTLRLVVMLGATDLVVGVTSYVDRYANKLEDILAYPELLNPSIARVGLGAEIDVEKIAEVKPDVVLLYAPYSYLADQIEQKAKVPVVCVSAGTTPQEFYKALRLVAKILGREARAEEIIAYFETKIQDVTNRIPKDRSAPRVYLADWAYRYGVGWTTSVYWPLDVAGGVNVAKEVGKRLNTTYFEVSKEQIVQWDPDVIFIHGYKGRSSVDAILNDPALKSVKAVREGRVFGVFGPYIGHDPKTWLIDMYHIAKTLYPDSFKDVDVMKIGEEVFRFFYGDKGPSIFHQVIVNRGVYLSPDLTP